MADRGRGLAPTPRVAAASPHQRPNRHTLRRSRRPCNRRRSRGGGSPTCTRKSSNHQTNPGNGCQSGWVPTRRKLNTEESPRLRFVSSSGAGLRLWRAFGPLGRAGCAGRAARHARAWSSIGGPAATGSTLATQPQNATAAEAFRPVPTRSAATKPLYGLRPDEAPIKRLLLDGPVLA